MFEEYCPTHDSRVLLSPSRIAAIHNSADGVVVTWRCWCGHVGRSVRGRGPSAAVATPASTPVAASASAPASAVASTPAGERAPLCHAC
jgi:hypothetical protein